MLAHLVKEVSSLGETAAARCAQRRVTACRLSFNALRRRPIFAVWQPKL